MEMLLKKKTFDSGINSWNYSTSSTSVQLNSNSSSLSSNSQYGPGQANSPLVISNAANVSEPQLTSASFLANSTVNSNSNAGKGSATNKNILVSVSSSSKLHFWLYFLYRVSRNDSQI